MFNARAELRNAIPRPRPQTPNFRRFPPKISILMLSVLRFFCFCLFQTVFSSGININSFFCDCKMENGCYIYTIAIKIQFLRDERYGTFH